MAVTLANKVISIWLSDSEYGYLFEFVTPDNNNATSELVNFNIKDGEIFTTKLEDLGD